MDFLKKYCVPFGFLIYFCFLIFTIVRINPDILVPSKKRFLEREFSPQDMVKIPVPQKEKTDRISRPSFQFRGGIQRQGTFDLNGQLPTEEQWNFRNLNVGIHSASKATPAVDKTGVYVGADSSWFYAFQNNGKLKWKFYVGSARMGIHGSAALDQSSVYFGAYNGNFYSLNKQTGKVNWVINLGTAIGASPVIYKNNIYISVETFHPNGFVACLNTETGKVIWLSSWMGNHPHSSPVVDEINNQIYVGSNSNKLFAFSIENGKKTWEFDALGPVKGTPTLVEQKVFFTSWGKFLFSLNGNDGSENWRAPLDDISQNSVTYDIKSDLLFVGDKAGKLYAFEQKTGRLRWKKTTQLKRMLSSPILLRSKQSSYLLNPCSKTSICVYKPENGKIITNIAVREVISGTPSIFGNSMFVAQENFGGLSKFGPAKVDQK